MSVKDLYHNKWARMTFWSVLYLLWVIWLGNYWWLFGLLVIFDHHITRKVKWLFWKKTIRKARRGMHCWTGLMPSSSQSCS